MYSSKERFINLSKNNQKCLIIIIFLIFVYASYVTLAA